MNIYIFFINMNTCKSQHVPKFRRVVTVILE